MNIELVKKIDRLTVYKNNAAVADLSRTKTGCEFCYRENYLHNPLAKPIAATLPLRETPLHTTGDNVPPFFAGLLPEGRRLEALVQSIKTSSDDLFSILAASGEETIGNVHVGFEGQPTTDNSLPSPSDISETTFSELFAYSIGHKELRWHDRDSAIAGIIPKLSSQLISFPVALAKRKKRYILKLGPEKYPQLVENELFFMSLAKRCGIDVANVSLVTDQTGARGLLVERFDRRFNKELKQMEKIHQEDTCQLLGRYPQDKYRLSMRDIADAIIATTSSPEIEVSRLLELFLFSYFIANRDMHAKNISIVEDAASSRVRLSPGYDLLSTLPYGDQTMALDFEGKNKNIRRKDILHFATRAGIREAVIKSLIYRIATPISKSLDTVSDIGLDKKKTDFLVRTMSDRIEAIAD